jgi:hypothetical protein
MSKKRTATNDIKRNKKNPSEAEGGKHRYNKIRFLVRLIVSKNWDGGRAHQQIEVDETESATKICF